ncbi:YbhN family protein [Haladaptatus sp. CMAA 1911]|uniref:lysylphosphatidylglycerol synthase transmembrane domain-containing protein n=1 Tax=unclassified Haladaptatus TaxID=2622732 RepID=UPI0037548692
MAAWGMALRTVLGELNIRISPQKGFFVLSGVIFFNNITPFGQAGGEPLTAHLISRVTDSEYETGLAAVVSADTLNFVPSISLAIFGVCYFLLTSTLDGPLEIAAVFVVFLAVAIPSLLIIGWRHRDGLKEFLVNRLIFVLKKFTQHVSWISMPTESMIADRVDRFFRLIQRITSSRRSLAFSLCYSTLGWALQVLSLWLAFRTINHSIPFSVALSSFQLLPLLVLRHYQEEPVLLREY